MDQSPFPRPARRHDLDALRAIAMLLGIALHAALSFAPGVSGVWPVQDVRQNVAFELLNASIHGFRMPLFFLLSGFFTAMLWRSRGLKSLVSQRVRRIFLPLAASTLTIVPLTWGAIIYAGMSRSGADTTSQKTTGGVDVWTAAAQNDLDQLAAFADQGGNLDEIGVPHGSTALGTAAAYGHTEATAWLLEHGADPNGRSRDQDTPLHIAAFFGRDNICQMLLDHGADADAKSSKNARPIDNAQLDWGITQFVATLIGVKVDRQVVEAGREKAIAMLKLHSSSDEPVTAPSSTFALTGLLMLLMYFPVFHHLWFLWYLCWLLPVFAAYAWLANRLRWKTLPRWTMLTHARWLWLIPLTLLLQSTMGTIVPTFGPDTATGLIPAPNILLYYAIFFFFGVWYFDSDDSESRISHGWQWMLPIALLVVFPIGHEFAIGSFGLRQSWMSATWWGLISSWAQVLYVWLMIFGCMGLFRHVFQGESPAMRYLSDSSYWLYLAHLPLIIIAQRIVRDWQVPSGVKFTLLLVVVCGLLVLSYAWLVRYTWIGRMLNGPRERRYSAPVVSMVGESAAN